MTDLKFIFTTKKVIIEGEHYIETTEGYEGQPQKWLRYGPIPESMMDEVAKSLHDMASRILMSAMWSVERGILLPAPNQPTIYGKPFYENPAIFDRFSPPDDNFTPPVIGA